MTKILVFTPTIHYGGLDILVSSISRQTYTSDICIADDLLTERYHIYDKYFPQNIIFVDCIKKEENVRALAQAYNNAADYAVDSGYDLLISLQDYIWIPDNGFELFVEVHKEHPNALLTGLVSLSEAPRREDIKDTYGLFTIFDKPLYSKPEGISWHDVRGTDLYPGDEPSVRACTPEHWEANWAAIPVELFRQGARWDLSYDEGVAYENQDFAKNCEMEFGTPCILDKRNHAYGIPHREIWPEEEKLLKRYNNRFKHEQKWG